MLELQRGGVKMFSLLSRNYVAEGFNKRMILTFPIHEKDSVLNFTCGLPVARGVYFFVILQFVRNYNGVT